MGSGILSNELDAIGNGSPCYCREWNGIGNHMNRTSIKRIPIIINTEGIPLK